MPLELRPDGFRWVTSLFAILVAAPAVGQDLTWFDAIRTEDLDGVRSLLDEGADPNQKVDILGGPATPLAVAVLGRQEDVALLLLERGARMERSDEFDVLSQAADHGLTRVVEFLLRQDWSRFTRFSDPDLDFRRRGLELSAQNGHFDLVDLMLRLSQEFDAPIPLESLGHATLVAMGSGHQDIARRLIEFTRVPHFGALSGAAHVGSPGMVRELLDLGADPYERYTRDSYPVELALARYSEARTPLDLEITGLILDELRHAYSADLAQRAARVARNGRDYLNTLAVAEPDRAFIEAARLGYYGIVKDFVQTGMPGLSREVRSAVMAEALRTALLAGHDDIARWLLQSGAPFEDGALHAAARRSSAGMVRYLLSLGADPLARFDGRTPVEYWLERVELSGRFTDRYVLYELIVGGADVCWLTEHSATLNISNIVLRDRAPHCWPDQLRGELRDLARGVR